MHDAQLQSFLRSATDELQKTSRIASCNDGRARGFDVSDLPIEKFTSHLWLSEIVNARAAAAPIGLGQLNQLQVRDGAQ